jgi:hypothetical protein
VVGLRGYIAFTKDMEIPINKQRVIEVWKKSSVSNQPHKFEDFVSSLTKLGTASLKHLIE